MSELDIDQLVIRFRRLDQAVEIGLGELEAGERPAVRLAVADAAEEAVSLAEVILRLAAEEDLWPLLGGVLALWARAGEIVDGAALAGAPTRSDVDAVRRLARQLAEIHDRVEAVERALAELAVHPSDRSCDAATEVAIQDLLAAGDALVPMALAVPGTTRLDAAVAALQSVAARGGSAGRRRASLRAER